MGQLAQRERRQLKSKPSNDKFDLEIKMKMTPAEQLVYMKSHWNEIKTSIKAFDDKMSNLNISLTEDEIADIVSKDRRERYEASLSH